MAPSMASTPSRQFHILLSGTDRYDGFPLATCVNDIDAFADFLRRRMGVPTAAVRNLVAPAMNVQRIAGLRAALQSLGRIGIP